MLSHSSSLTNYHSVLQALPSENFNRTRYACASVLSKQVLKPMSDTLNSNTSQQKKGKLKPLLLSALVFPGLGQLSQGKKVLAIVIILACVFCLYIVLGEAMSEINAAAERMLNSGSTDIYRAQEESHAILMNLKTFKFLAALYSLIGLWIFSIVDIFRAQTQ